MTSFHMEAVLDQRSLTNSESEHEKSQQETNHTQHDHDPGRGYQLLQSAVYRGINMETLSGLHRLGDSEVTARTWQHFLFPLAIKWTPATAEPRALTVKAAEPLPVPNHTLFLQQMVMNKKSRLSKPIFTCISCCPGNQHSYLPESSRETT